MSFQKLQLLKIYCDFLFVKDKQECERERERERERKIRYIQCHLSFVRNSARMFSKLRMELGDTHNTYLYLYLKRSPQSFEWPASGIRSLSLARVHHSFLSSAVIVISWTLELHPEAA